VQTALAGVLDRFHAHAGAIVTTSDFTKPAKKEAELFFWKVGLTNFQSLVEMLRRAELLVKPPITFSADRTDPPESAATFSTDRTNPPESAAVFLKAINVQRT
jgi:hypothetical protein